MNGLELIQQERKRQQEMEGWTLEHDKQHDRGELKEAALCYWGYGTMWNDEDIDELWPWEKSWWKPNSNTTKNLIKAGALFMAENERAENNECDIQIRMLSKRIDQRLKISNRSN